MLEITKFSSLFISTIAFILCISLFTQKASRSGLFYYITLFLLLASMSFTVHSVIEALGPNMGLSENLIEQLYAITSVIASMFIFFLIIIIQIISKLLLRGK